MSARCRAVGAAVALTALVAGGSVGAATLWSVDESHLGTGHLFGPGAYPVPTPLFPVMLRNLAFTADRDFITPFWNNGAALPNVRGEADQPPVDGLLSDGSRINENADMGSFMLAGTRILPAVVEGGEFSGAQLAIAFADGNLVMVMDLVMDLGIGERGIIRMPFYGTTGTVTIPPGLVPPGGATAIDRAGPLASGETIAGRIGDFNGDGFIDGTLVAVGVMPVTSPVFAGQPFALIRNFETDIPINGMQAGSPTLVDSIYRAGATPTPEVEP